MAPRVRRRFHSRSRFDADHAPAKSGIRGPRRPAKALGQRPPICFPRTDSGSWGGPFCQQTAGVTEWGPLQPLILSGVRISLPTILSICQFVTVSPAAAGTPPPPRSAGRVSSFPICLVVHGRATQCPQSARQHSWPSAPLCASTDLPGSISPTIPPGGGMPRGSKSWQTKCLELPWDLPANLPRRQAPEVPVLPWHWEALPGTKLPCGPHQTIPARRGSHPRLPPRHLLGRPAVPNRSGVS
jgi:hypothetical protein